MIDRDGILKYGRDLSQCPNLDSCDMRDRQGVFFTNKIGEAVNWGVKLIRVTDGRIPEKHEVCVYAVDTQQALQHGIIFDRDEMPDVNNGWMSRAQDIPFTCQCIRRLTENELQPDRDAWWKTWMPLLSTKRVISRSFARR